MNVATENIEISMSYVSNTYAWERQKWNKTKKEGKEATETENTLKEAQRVTEGEGSG